MSVTKSQSLEAKGIFLDSLGPVISSALNEYSRMTDGRIGFDTIEAGHLLRRNESHPLAAAYPAVSKTPVRHLGEAAGVLSVVLLASDDNTGITKNEQGSKARKSALSQRKLIIPRSRGGVLSESYLTIASFPEGTTKSDPLMFVGHGNVFGVAAGSDAVGYAGTVGQDEASYVNLVQRYKNHVPTVTPMIRHHFDCVSDLSMSRPFGEAYAIHNPHPEIQIGAFVTVTTQQDSGKHYRMLELFDKA